MKSKKLLISLIVVALVVVAIVVLASVFTLKTSIVVCHNFAGDNFTGLTGSPSEDDITELFSGKNIIFLSKSAITKQLNKAFPDWHVVGIVKNPPNCLEVHFLKRTAVAKVDIGGKDVYLDIFGYQVAAPTDGSVPVDITSAFVLPNVAMTVDDGEPFKFANDLNNQRLSCVLDCMMALWQCRVDFPNFPTVVGSQNVFTFDEDNSMILTTDVGARIKFMEPSKTVSKMFIKAYSVYCSDEYVLQKPGVEITVWPDGKITTPEKNLTRI